MDRLWIFLVLIFPLLFLTPFDVSGSQDTQKVYPIYTPSEMMLVERAPYKQITEIYFQHIWNKHCLKIPKDMHENSPCYRYAVQSAGEILEFLKWLKMKDEKIERNILDLVKKRYKAPWYY